MNESQNPREKNANETERTLAGLDGYQWHLVGYAGFVSMAIFYMTMWVDLHAPSYYKTEYPNRFGLPSQFFFATAGVTACILLIWMFRKFKPGRKDCVLLVSALSPLSIFFGYCVGCLGYVNWIGSLHAAVLMTCVVISAVLGLGTWTHYHARGFFGDMTRREARREYDLRVKLFGDLLQAITVLIVSGGLGIVLAIGSYLKGIFIPETINSWLWASPFMLLLMAYGAYIVFLVRLLTSTGELNDRLKTLEEEENVQSPHREETSHKSRKKAHS